MIRIGILGDIGSGKSYVANNLGFPVFDADYEVAKLYKKNKKIFLKLILIFVCLVNMDLRYSYDHRKQFFYFQ